MRQTIIGQIELGNFDLKDMIDRINYYHVAGELSNADREYLIALARAKAIESMEINPKTEILALWEAIHALQERVNALEEGGGDAPAPPVDEYPEFVQPTGAHDAYQMGQKCTYHGKHYESVIPNNVWAPDLYPAGWKEVA